MNDDPMGDTYWNAFDTALKQTEVDRNRRDAAYGSLGDPGTGGWRRPTVEELQAERESQRRAEAD